MSRRCCCPICTVFGDDYDRTAGTDVGSDWVEYAGNWVIIEDDPGLPILGSLKENGNVDALIAVIDDHKTRNIYQNVAIDFVGLQTGDKPRIVFNLVDSQNYFYVQMEPTALTTILTFVKVSGGTHTTLKTETVGTMDDPAETSVCVNEESITWTATPTPQIYSWLCDPPLHAGGLRSGVGNGGTTPIIVGSFDVRNFYGVDGDVNGECCDQQCKCRGKCIPQTLTGTIRATGGCAPIDGKSFPITYDPSVDAWISVGDQPSPCVNSKWMFACNNSECTSLSPTPEFSLTNGGGSGCITPDICIQYSEPSISVECDPLIVVFGVSTHLPPDQPTGDCSCCDEEQESTIQVIVTE